MSLPWVSREAFDALDKAWHELHFADLQRYDALLEKYHALKLQGAFIPEPAVQHTPRGPEPKDELKALIAAQAGTDLRRRGMMLRQLRQDRADGVSPEEIRRSIENGVQSDGVSA